MQPPVRPRSPLIAPQPVLPNRQAVAIERAVDGQNAVEMVDLVLQQFREGSLALRLLGSRRVRPGNTPARIDIRPMLCSLIHAHSG